MNIPKDPLSVDPSYIPPQNNPIEQASGAQSLSGHQDSVETSSGESPKRATQSTSSPQLETPKTSNDYSLIDFFRAISEATRAFRKQLSASEYADLSLRHSATQLALSDIKSLLSLYKERQDAIAKIEKEAKQELEELQKKLKEMQDLANEQENRINELNSGSPLEQQKYQELILAYDNYVNNLKNIGVVDLGNGNFSVPDGAQDKFNFFTQQYQEGVNKFNNYWEGRLNEINAYNSATIDYNKKVLEYNKAVEEFVSKFNLSEYLLNNQLKIPILGGAGLRDVSGYRSQLEKPSLISGPGTVQTYPPPTYARSIAQSGPPLLTKLTPFTPLSANDSHTIYVGVYSSLYESQVSPIDQQIKASTITYSPFLNRQQWLFLSEDSIPDPILNNKPLALKILPAAIINPKPPLSSSSGEANLFIMQAMGLGSSHIQSILGQKLLKQVLEGTQLETLDTLDKEQREEKIKIFMDRLMLLSVGLLSNHSLQALFPGFSIIADALSSLPKDSPAFSLLFSVSLANRIQEEIGQDSLSPALRTLLKDIPEFAQLPETEIEQLTTILSLGQLLTAGKLLEENLGLPGLLATILSSHLTTAEANTLSSQTQQENRQESEKLQTLLYDHASSQGYSEEIALFLAQIGSQLVQQGLSTPSITAISSPQSIQKPLLVDSIKAALILTGDYSLTQAEALAQEALDLTFLDTPFLSTQKFRQTLESHLKDLGVPRSSDIATQAVLLPAIDNRLKLSEKSPLSQAELTTLIETRSFQLLSPQLGTELSKQITQEIIKTLFGNSSKSDPTNNPLSLLNEINKQTQIINKNQKQTKVLETFKETIKNKEDFYAFSLKIMDPAYLFIFSSNPGMISSNQTNKKMDIFI